MQIFLNFKKLKKNTKKKYGIKKLLNKKNLKKK